MSREGLGLLQIYTGEGKGKTTASLGLALRAWGHGLHICVVQFMKKGDDYGEIKALRRLGVDVFQFGSGRFVHQGKDNKEEKELALRGLDFAVAAIHSGEYDLVILDEINVATYFELLDPKEVLSKVDGHEGVEVVFTGRRAPPEFLAAADLVTVMELVKHPYDKGVDARKGVEF
ncbi:MAG: cob(I)yrinic acid a,c-diamide adenosyltransferase [Methanomassiliicoccales archaeon]